MKNVPGEVNDLSRMADEWIALDSDGAQIRAFMARPVSVAAKAGLIVIHEAFGLNDHIIDLTRRFANLGLIAVAPDLYSRTGTPENNLPKVLEAMFGLSDAQVVSDLRTAMIFLKREGLHRIGSIGFCSGGRQSLLLAFSKSGLTAAIDCWGGFIARATQEALTTPQRPKTVLDMSDGLDCPLFAAFGAEDQNPSLADAEALRAHTLGKDVTIKVYENAGHAFLADYRPTYREEPAFLLWEDLKDFLARKLIGPAN